MIRLLEENERLKKLLKAQCHTIENLAPHPPDSSSTKTISAGMAVVIACFTSSIESPP